MTGKKKKQRTQTELLGFINILSMNEFGAIVPSFVAKETAVVFATLITFYIIKN